MPAIKNMRYFLPLLLIVFCESTLARYAQPDPIGLNGGINPFVYANGNPVMNIDPNGLLSLTITGGAQSTPVKGINAGGGVYITNGGTTQQASSGMISTTSLTTGFNATSGVAFDLYSGGMENLDGKGVTATTCLGLICVNIHKDPCEKNVTGLGISIGPGLPGGFSFMKDTSTAIPFSEIFQAY